METESTDALIERHMDRARAAAFSEARRRGIMHDYDDLEAAAYHGLCVAARAYRRGFGTQFWTYAFNQVRWRISAEVKRRFRLPPCWLTVDRDNADETHFHSQCSPEFSHNPPHPADGMDDPLHLFRLRTRGLKPRTRAMMEARYVHGKLLEEIGQEYGISRERVRQCINRGLERLREKMGVKLKGRKARKKVKRGEIKRSTAEVQAVPARVARRKRPPGRVGKVRRQPAAAVL